MMTSRKRLLLTSSFLLAGSFAVGCTDDSDVNNVERGNPHYERCSTREPTEFDDMADLVVRQDIGNVLAPFIAD